MKKALGRAATELERLRKKFIIEDTSGIGRLRGFSKDVFYTKPAQLLFYTPFGYVVLALIFLGVYLGVSLGTNVGTYTYATADTFNVNKTLTQSVVTTTTASTLNITLIASLFTSFAFVAAALTYLAKVYRDSNSDQREAAQTELTNLLKIDITVLYDVDLTLQRCTRGVITSDHHILNDDVRRRFSLLVDQQNRGLIATDHRIMSQKLINTARQYASAFQRCILSSGRYLPGDTEIPIKITHENKMFTVH
jgi:hypothetical protein